MSKQGGKSRTKGQSRKSKQVIVDRQDIETKLAEVIADIGNKEDNCIEYAFLPDEIAATIDSTNNYKNMDDEKFIPYNNWIEHTFFKPEDKLEKTGTHIRKIVKGSKEYFESGIHREFSPPGFGEDFIYNILCYFKTENCKLSECGLGLVYVDIHNQLKKVNLPVINGLTLKIRDKCFYHYTPELHPIDDSKPVVRIIIRDYYRLGPITFENTLSSFNNHKNALNQLHNTNAYRREAQKTKKRHNLRTQNEALTGAQLGLLFSEPKTSKHEQNKILENVNLGTFFNAI
jgi:hypothetical protein